MRAGAGTPTTSGWPWPITSAARTSRRLERAYLAGYGSVRRLSEQSLALLPLFRLVRGLAQIGWFHQRPELDRTARFEEVKAIVLDQWLSFGRAL